MMLMVIYNYFILDANSRSLPILLSYTPSILYHKKQNKKTSKPMQSLINRFLLNIFTNIA